MSYLCLSETLDLIPIVATPSLRKQLLITRCGEPVIQATNTPFHFAKALADSFHDLGYRGSGADSATARETKSAKAVLGKDLAVCLL